MSGYDDGFPEIATGINLVEAPKDLPVLQRIAAEAVKARGSEALWIDTGNESSTYELSRMLDEREMQRVRIGRAFTAFQHHSLVREAEKYLTPAVDTLILSNLPQMYMEGLDQKEVEDLFLETWRSLKQLAEKNDLRIVVTARDRNPLKPFIRDNCGNELKVEKNSQGVVYDGPSDETVYRGQGYYQTTVTAWEKRRKQEVDA